MWSCHYQEAIYTEPIHWGALHMLRAAVIVLLIALLPSPLRAEARIALLIGNQHYNPKVGLLRNPHDDIALVGAALKPLGFTVTELRDADYRSMDAAIKRHATAVRREGAGTISLLYYSGHGAADPDTRTNYLIPVDVAEADDADLWNYSLNLNKIVEGLREQAPAATHYVVFDACRNELNLTRKGAKALTDKGFVPIAYTPGVMVAYATAPGKTATDTGSGGGPYAKALAEELVKPGIEAMTMFRHVALRVNREIGQDPWMSASTLPEVYFAGAPNPSGYNAPAPVSARSSETAAAEAWAAAKETNDPTVLEAFVERYKDSFYASLARSRLKELSERKVAIAKPATPILDASEIDPKKAYDAAYGYLQQRDYGAAEAAFDAFVKRYPNDPLAGNAQYWLGESLYVRGQYRAAAGAFLKGYQSYSHNAKAPESLLKLAMSLQRLGQKDAACASYVEFSAKFPNAPPHVKAVAEIERQRAGC
jgi:tol-pal system protein YbgF